MIRYARARPENAATLAEVSGRASDDDVHYGAPSPGMPCWNLRTQHFYAKMGYMCGGSEGPDGLSYEAEAFLAAKEHYPPLALLAHRPSQPGDTQYHLCQKIR